MTGFQAPCVALLSFLSAVIKKSKFAPVVILGIGISLVHAQTINSESPH